MATVSIERFLEDFSKELLQKNTAIFAGAGLSVPAGFVDWKGLLRPLAEEISLDVDREHDLVKVAQYHVNAHSNRSDISNAVLNEFSTRTASITINHKILSRLPISSYWTTNYDPIIENALRESGKIADVKHSPEHLVHTLQGRDVVVYKMHGDYQNPVNAVICKEDYERYHLTRGDFLTALAGDLLSKMFLFIGFSFTDPNMDYVLSRLHTRYGQNQRKHYCIVRKESPNDNASCDFNYRKARQDHFVRDLERYNIRAVMVDSYDQITDILLRLEGKFKSKTIFVSGAAHDYGNYSAEEALNFVHKLSSSLISKDYKIVTGLGLGIGSTIIDGALQNIYHIQKKSFQDQIIIRPFPQSSDGKKLWREYRDDMLNFAGISIFMFGNKNDDSGGIIELNGMIEEFDISVSKGIKVLPLGFTGFAAKKLYEKVKNNLNNFYPNAPSSFKEIYNHLGDDEITLDEQLRNIIIALSQIEKI